MFVIELVIMCAQFKPTIDAFVIYYTSVSAILKKVNYAQIWIYDIHNVKCICPMYI